MFEELLPSRVGMWLYANELPMAVRIVRRDMRYGTGDYQDEASIAEDLAQETFYVLYQTSAGEPRWCGDGSEPTLDAASELAERMLGPTLKWAPFQVRTPP